MLPVVIIPAYKPGPPLAPLVEALVAEPDRHVIVVNDGSPAAFDHIFEAVAMLPRVTLLRHATNLGKGQALKTAFNHFLTDTTLGSPGVVTADADGQHLVEDIRRVSDALVANSGALGLGARQRRGPVPWKSALGNGLTRHVFRAVVGVQLQDTQSGLRGLPRALLPHLLRLQASGYEFELEMLILAIRSGVPIREIPIAMVYEPGNPTTHFSPLWDSLRIYFVFVRFAGLSLATAALDFSVFALAYGASGQVLGSTMLARLVAGTFNFHFARSVVFRSTGTVGREAARYVVLVLWLMALSYGLVTSLVIFVGLSVYAAKIVAETALFLASFALQRVLVFDRAPRSS